MSTDLNAAQPGASGTNSSKITKKKWLIWASAFAAILVITYALLHWCLYDSKGEKTHRLSTTEFAAVTSIVQSGETNQNSTTIPGDTLQPGDTLPNGDTLKLALIMPPVNPKPCDSLTEQRVKDYLNDIMVLKNKEAVYNMIDDQGVKNVTYLSNYPFKVQSYFWLSDYWVLLEVVFWSLFGLIANLMYSVTRTKEEDVDGDGKADKPEVFDPNRVSEHIGKFWYTPLTSIVIYLSIDYLTASGEIQESPEGAFVVVFAFILGFFSRRTIALLRKIKDIFFPNDTNGSSGSEEQSETPNPDPGPETDPTVTPGTETDPAETSETESNPESTTDPTSTPDSTQSPDTPPTTEPGITTKSDPTPAPKPDSSTSVTINGKVVAGPSTNLKSLSGTVINLYAAGDASTPMQTVTLAKGTDGTFTFKDPVPVGVYTYSASKTLSKNSYSGAGDISADGSSATVSVSITLMEAAG